MRRANRHDRRRGVRGRLALLATALVLPMAAGLTPPPVAAQPTATPVAASVQRVVWLGDRRVALSVFSPSMGAPVQIQLLLARDWNARPDARFPVLFMLDGLRATDEENGWTKDAGAQDFYADKNVTVVLPIGGQSSFYSDWLRPDNGRTYMWETFLTRELPALLESQWRATDARGMQGLSMGGTAAMFLAGRNPGFARYAASYSGFLTTTTLGMPQAIDFAMRDAGGFDSAAMWGPPTSPEWENHDPYALAEKLKGVSLYISSGSGATGPHDLATGIPGISTNLAGTGLEILSRLTSQNFVTKLGELSIPAQVNYRPSGTHTWPYWDFEMRQSWPQAAAALAVEENKPACAPGGAIAPVAEGNGWLGDCLTGEYPVEGGLAQDFRHGRVLWSQAAGAFPVGGPIGGGYQAAEGPGGALGLPTGFEIGLPDGRGRMQTFQNGSLYWTPQTGAQVVRGAILEEWARQGFERGPAAYPTGPEQRTPTADGTVQGFEGGPFYYSPRTGAHPVGGLILAKYAEQGFENSKLGFPTGEEAPLKDLGRYTTFEGGNIYWSPLSGAWAVRRGPIMDAWGAEHFENGRLGYPISDEFPVPGGTQQNFQAGFVVVRGDRPEVHGLP
ncbi:alpha/beta hydrolase-fold protein [Nocardia takedensis]|uniref:alpha/beta hydrolase-fold protein n=1 Tax=Nocardia takedensis TaxID=259390 RepID=UPI000684ACD3|nr:alpha/beta hydrolase-fold protein [Nocardia takedensis]